MFSRPRLTLLLAGAVAPALVLASALGARAATSAPTSHARPATATAAARVATVRVTIQGYAFKPKTITVAPGTRVIWTNKDSDTHTVFSDTDAFTESDDLTHGKSFAHTFTKAGTYTYHCGQHPFMTGTVIVKGAKSAKR